MSQKEPVANHYNDLQSILELKQFFESLPSNVSPELREALILAGGLDLLLMACADICTRGELQITSDRQNDTLFDTLADHSIWHRDLMMLIFHFAGRLRATCWNTAQADGTPLGIPTTPGLVKYSIARKGFDTALCQLLADAHYKQSFSTAIRTGKGANTLASLQHTLKQSNHLYRSIIYRLHLPKVCSNQISDSLGQPYLSTAVEGLQIKERDTYFCQFRVLHQVPELLALEVRRLKDIFLDFVTQTGVAPLRVALATMSAMTVFIQDMTRCLLPIASNMYPASYRLIRRNLGKTSGSQSESLKTKVFSEDFFEVTRCVIELGNHGQGRRRALVQRIQAEHFRLTEAIYAWRDLHLQFPRNVLGGGGTKSLIGKDDAVSYATHLNTSFIKRHAKLVQDRSPRLWMIPNGVPTAFDADQPVYAESVNQLDQLLLEITGEVVRSLFPDVQNREGFFSDET